VYSKHQASLYKFCLHCFGESKSNLVQATNHGMADFFEDDTSASLLIATMTFQTKTWQVLKTCQVSSFT